MISNGNCSYLPSDECRQIGYSAFVRAGVTLNDEASFKGALQSIIKTAANNTQLYSSLLLYACATYFPPCDPTNILIQPCRSLCGGKYLIRFHAVNRLY